MAAIRTAAGQDAGLHWPGRCGVVLRRTAAALCILLLAACGKVELYGSLSEREANEMLALLLRAGIAAEKSVGKNSVTALRVEAGRVPDAVELLNAAGLPRERFTNMGDLFRREGLISSPSEERVRYIYGITQELSRTLTAIDGVVSARVHIVLPNNDPLAGGPIRPSTASVLIRHAPDMPIESSVPRIKELVANAIEGMTYDRVAVVLIRARAEELVPRRVEAEALGTMGGGIVYGSLGLLALSLLGNGALAFVAFRRRRASSLPPLAGPS